MCVALPTGDVRTHYLPGFRASLDLSPVRSIQTGGRALLHHRCSSPSLRDIIDPDRNWFVCEQRDRPIDADAIFDPFCSECEKRWMAGGSRYWNPQAEK
jgi:hypothetical protein